MGNTNERKKSCGEKKIVWRKKKGLKTQQNKKNYVLIEAM